MVSKSYIVFYCFLASVLAEEKYSDKYDNIDVPGTLQNERLYASYFKCVIGEGKCTPEGNELKIHIPEALGDGCEKCTEVQKNKTATVIAFIAENKPEDWKILTAKYDPDGKWTAKYEEEAKKRNIRLPKP